MKPFVRLACFLFALVLPAAATSVGTSETSGQTTPESARVVVIPGPLKPFLRMAGISQKSAPEEILPFLSRNILLQGYSQGHPTEFLILVNRYVKQARELTSLAGTDQVIRVSSCDQAPALLAILGYRLRSACGQPDALLETADPERAFVTTNSGFPLPELEHALAGGAPFAYPYAGSAVPGMFSEGEWIDVGKAGSQLRDHHLVDALIRDPDLARLYWALSRLDPDTRAALHGSLGIRKLIRHAAVLDFYGGHLSIRDGRVVVPGGPASEAAWRQLVGASPEAPADFIENLLSKGRGWMAAYFDVISRVNARQQAYFADPNRLSHFYAALLAPNRSEEATKGAFRPAPQLLLLATRLQWEQNGQPLVPGNLQVWKEILEQETKLGSNYRRVQRASRLADADQLIETMVSLTRLRTSVGPLQMYLAISELDGRRSAENRLSPETVRLLARKFELFSSQYRIFSEFPELSNESIARFLRAAESLDGISSNPLRGNALGIFQANIGLWQILARQRQISGAQLNESWQQIVQPFERIQSGAQLFDAGQTAIQRLVRAATGKDVFYQQQIVDLLAGPLIATPDAQRMHREFVDRILSVLDSQRLVSLDTLLSLNDALKDKAQGKPLSDTVLHMAGELREFQMPQPIFSSTERTEWAAGIYNNSHTDSEMRTDLARVFKSSAAGAQVLEARGQLASFWRDTVVALNYAYYEPPGAQILHHNPLLVRSHDFAAETVMGLKGVWQAPQMFGEGSPAGGGAHLVGSLADLPYVLAQIEQDFIAPRNIQALIWRELVPSLLTSAVVPRWWGVSPEEMHAITLYQRSGEEILSAAVGDQELRSRVLAILSERMTPLVLQRTEYNLRAGNVQDLMRQILPADTFYLAAELRRQNSDLARSLGSASLELETLTHKNPQDVAWDRLSRDFGVPHPALAQTYARELLNLPPIPAFEGYASRLLAESWDSNNLYWARLLDEAGYSPLELNRLVPELTRRMVERVSATNFEDWPALLRAMRETGDDFRQGRMEAASMTDSNGKGDSNSAVQ